MGFLVHHLLQASVARLPNKEALVHGNERFSYGELSKCVNGVACGLRQAGLARGDRVGIYLDPSMSQVISIFAISRAGGIFVPINSLLFPEQVMHIARDCGMKALITTATRMASLLPAIEMLTSLEFLILVPDAEVPKTRRAVFSFPELTKQAPADIWFDWNISRDLAAILYTSGSTGKPKGVMLSHDNIISGGTIVSEYLEITEQERILAVLPFSFDAGLNQLITAFQQAATLVLLKFVFARDIVNLLLAERITGLAGVPTVWSLLAQPTSGIQKQSFPHLRYITNTGGAMPQNVLSTLRQQLPTTRIFLMYGLTEAFRSTYLPPEELDRRPTSIGKAIPNTEILVINEHGQPCRTDEIGELVHRGPTVSMGYWGNPEATAAVLRPNPVADPQIGAGERVCYSGDLVRRDRDGFLFYVGRRDTMIKSSGYRISPTEVEEVIFRSGLVRHAAVIGIPDELLGQSIKVFVTPPDGEDVDVERLLQYCGEKMPRYMVPKSVEVLQELPTTTTGKIDYPQLRQREGLT